MSAFVKPALDIASRSAPTALAAVVGVATLPALYYYKNQRALVYSGTTALPYFRHQCLTPSHFGVSSSDWQALSVTAPDGIVSRGYLMLQPNAEQRPTVVYYHGNGGNVGHYLLQTIPMFQEMKLNIVIGSYRGCGLSDGSPSEEGMRQDAESTFTYVLQHPRLSQTSKILFGTSMGGAVVSRLAREHSEKVKAVILENSFISVLEAATDLRIAPPFIFKLLSPLTTERWETYIDSSQLPKDLPALFLASGKDVHIPAWHVRKLFDLSSGLKTFYQFDEASHMTTYHSPSYYTLLQNFLKHHHAISATDEPVRESNIEIILEKCLHILRAFPDLPLADEKGASN